MKFPQLVYQAWNMPNAAYGLILICQSSITFK